MQNRSSTSQSGLENSATELKAPLKSALSSLNITLEEELTRYRRQRQGHPAPPPRRLKVKNQRPLDLITVKSPGSSPSSDLSPTVSGAVHIPPPPPPPYNPNLGGVEPPAIANGDATQVIPPEGSDNSPTVVTALATQADLSPENYLASSEALLQSLADDDTSTDASTLEPSSSRWLDSWSTPLGLGSLLLLLVGSAGLGYVLTNPAALSQVPLLGRLAKAPAPTSESASLEADGDGSNAADSTFYSLGPDLSSQEFVELNLNTLSTLELKRLTPLSPLPSTATSQATSPSTATTTPVAPTTSTPETASPPVPVAAARSTSTPPTASAPASQPPSPAVSRPSPPPISRSAPARSPSARPTPPAPAAATPAPAAAPTPAASSPPAAVNYYVVADYTGDQSLSAARTVVEDAYVRNFSEGARIQMGAFNSAEAAEKLAEDLQSQGISANVRED